MEESVAPNYAHNWFVTEADALFAREMFARQKAGWAYLEAERLAGLPATVTKNVLPLLQSSFTYSQTLPPRLESGFVEFYAALRRAKERCLT